MAMMFDGCKAPVGRFDYWQAVIKEFWDLASRGRLPWSPGRSTWRRLRSLVCLPEAGSALAGHIDNPSWLLKVRCTWWLAKDAVEEDMREEVA